MCRTRVCGGRVSGACRLRPLRLPSLEYCGVCSDNVYRPRWIEDTWCCAAVRTDCARCGRRRWRPGAGPAGWGAGNLLACFLANISTSCVITSGKVRPRLKREIGQRIHPSSSRCRSLAAVYNYCSQQRRPWTAGYTKDSPAYQRALSVQPRVTWACMGPSKCDKKIRWSGEYIADHKLIRRCMVKAATHTSWLNTVMKFFLHS